MTQKESERFPRTYGDLGMQCHDGVTCYFPKHLLTYMSPVFKDMIEISSPDAPSDPNSDHSLRLTETSTVLEAFLEHLDPNTVTLTIDEQTIEGILEASRKYQVDKVMRWFEVEVISLRSAPPDPAAATSLLTTNPLLVLHLADVYGLTQTAKQACRFLAGCQGSLLKKGDINLRLVVYLHVRKLRETRVTRYEGYLDQLAKRRRKYSKERYRELRDENGPDFGRNVYEDGVINPCLGCIAERASWVLGIRKAIAKSPNWNTFQTAYQTRSAFCPTCKVSWSDYFGRYVEDWEKDSGIKEKELPDWPF
ncbi:hypothetical protein CPB86DRAFT_755104 [Serendipita vermifera]|nr:hypothetical protein CPB86DRAFT_755104 [Serendipita vermifera]